MSRRLIIIGLLTALLLTGCGQEKELTVSGTIEANEVVVSAEVGGLVKEIPVAEGSQVKAGDVIAKLDPTIIQYQVEQAKAGFAAAEARAREVGAGSRAEQLRASKANVDQAKALVAGAQSQINSLQSSISDNEAKITELKGAGNYQQDPSARQQVASLEAAKTNLKLQLESSKSQLKVYQAQATGAQAQYDLLNAGATSQAKDSATAQADQARAALKLAEAQLSKCEIKSPVDGVITTQGVKLGELAGPGMSLAKVAVVKDLALTIYVPENQLARVQVGQQVQFKVDAYPNETFEGKIKKINTQAEFTPKNVQTPEERVNMVFGVKIEVTKGQDRLKPGMPADVSL